MAGVDHADQALRIAPRNPRALELRGVLQAMLWLSTPADSVMRSNPNLEAAHRDLDRATQYSSAAPRAWQYLSMILFARGEYALAYHAADRALEADAFLSDAAGVHAQHFWAALEVGDTTGARECCSQQNANDPDSWQGSYCRLVLLAWSGKPAADSSAVVRLVNTAQQKPYAEQNGGALDAVHAVLLAQRGDSIGARGLLGEVLRRADSRPDLLYHAAWVHATLGERDAARDLLERYVAGWPAARAGIARSQRFVGLLN
jgi:tetratricopeptide (TPR) repeat protein